MKQSSVFKALLAVCCVVFQECTAYNTKEHYVNIPTYTECGGVIPLNWNDMGASARVSYKNGTLFSPLEFCVWTFLAEDTAGEIILKFTENIQESFDGIVVYTWKDYNFTSYKIPHGNSELTTDAQHFAVAFSSDGSAESHGFYFDIIVEKAGDGVTNPKAYFFGQNMSEFSYPKIIGQDHYDGNQRVSVVLHGPRENPRPSREYGLRDLDTEENYDFVDVYILWNYYEAAHFTFVGRFSGQESGAVPNSGVVTHRPMLYLFSSDRKGTGKGFTITWKLY